jgi:ankyrin repeat protein
MTKIVAGSVADRFDQIDTGSELNKLDRYRQTPLHCACVNGHSNVVRYLLDKKASCSEKDHYGRCVRIHVVLLGQDLIFLHRTPLHCLALGGHVAATQVLVKKLKLFELKERDASGAPRAVVEGSKVNVVTGLEHRSDCVANCAGERVRSRGSRRSPGAA